MRRSEFLSGAATLRWVWGRVAPEPSAASSVRRELRLANAHVNSLLSRRLSDTPVSHETWLHSWQLAGPRFGLYNVAIGVVKKPEVSICSIGSESIDLTTMSGPRVLAVPSEFIPSTMITVVKPLLRLHELRRVELDIAHERAVQRHNVEWADVVVFCRNMRARYGRALEWARELDKPVMYELDDNLLEVPDAAPDAYVYRDPARRAQLRRYLEQADLVRVYSSALREYVANINPNVVKVDGPLDWSLVPDRPTRSSDHRVQVVYATSRLADVVGDIVVQDMQRVLDRYPQAEFAVWGPRVAALEDHARVHHFPLVPDYDSFFRSFARMGFDIGLAPLPEGLFYQCKSNNKFREYAACGIAGVYSDVDVYRECVIDDVNGLLVKAEEGAWFRAVSRLIEDESLRQDISRRAEVYARRHYSMERMLDAWQEHIDRVLSRRGPGSSARVVAVSGPAWVEPAATSSVVASGTDSVRRGHKLAQKLLTLLQTRGWRFMLGYLRVHGNSLAQTIRLKLRLRQRSSSRFK
jgi:glycosyltransferase involved in cell wall biosynthesis